MFRDQDSDDGYNFEIEIIPATNRIILSYWEANLDDPGRPQAEASFKSEYHFSQLSNKIRLIRTKFNFPKGFSVTEAQRIKQTQKMDERALRQLLTTQFKPVFLAALENYLSRHLPGWSNQASRSDKAHAKSVKQQNHTVKSEFLKKTFKPWYSDAVWRTAIRQRASFLGIKVAEITIAPLTENETSNYRAEQTAQVEIQDGVGSIRDTQGQYDYPERYYHIKD